MEYRHFDHQTCCKYRWKWEVQTPKCCKDCTVELAASSLFLFGWCNGSSGELFTFLGAMGGILWDHQPRNSPGTKSWTFHLCFCWKNRKQGRASAYGISSAETSWLNWGARASWSGICGYWLWGHSHSAGRKSEFSVWIGIHRMILDGVENPGIVWWRLFPDGFAPLADTSSWQCLVFVMVHCKFNGYVWINTCFCKI